MKNFLTAVVRLSGVRILQTDIEARLAVGLERYEAHTSYAQLAPGEDWTEVEIFLRQHGPDLKALHDAGAVEKVDLDIGFSFGDNMAAVTYSIPPSIIALAGVNGIGIDLSVYLTSN